VFGRSQERDGTSFDVRGMVIEMSRILHYSSLRHAIMSACGDGVISYLVSFSFLIVVRALKAILGGNPRPSTAVLCIAVLIGFIVLSIRSQRARGGNSRDSRLKYYMSRALLASVFPPTASTFVPRKV